MHVCQSNHPHAAAKNGKVLRALAPIARGQAATSTLWPSNKKSLRIAFSPNGFDLGGEKNYPDAKSFVIDIVNREYGDLCGMRPLFLRDSEYEAADVRIQFRGSDGAWSTVGTDANLVARNEATMNLGWLDSSADRNGAVITHEFGHAYGLMHEHSTAKFPFCWNRSRIQEELRDEPHNWSDEAINANVFDVIDSRLVSSLSSRYDVESVMGYSFPARFFLPAGDGCAAPPTEGIVYNTRLSALDKEVLGKLYPIQSVPSSTNEKHKITPLLLATIVCTVFSVLIAALVLTLYGNGRSGETGLGRPLALMVIHDDRKPSSSQPTDKESKQTDLDLPALSPSA